MPRYIDLSPKKLFGQEKVTVVKKKLDPLQWKSVTDYNDDLKDVIPMFNKATA